MPKPKKTQWTPVDAAKAAAHATLGPPPPTRVVPNRKKKRAAAPRHRETLNRLLSA